jgi:hypothetical protein
MNMRPLPPYGLAGGILVIAAAFAITAPGAAFAASRVVDLAPFTGADISAGLRATFTIGDTQSVVVDAENESDLGHVRLEVVGGRLHAWLDRGFWDMFTDSDTAITVSVPALDYLKATSGARVDVTGMSGDITLEATSGAAVTVGDVAAISAHIDLTSGASLMIDGECVTATVRTTSSARLGGEDFKCRDLEVEATSGSSAESRADRSVRAPATSGARVSVTGGPDYVDRDAESGGEIVLLD